MIEAEARAAVVAEAKSWLGTRYAHRQRLKGVAVDCAQMPLAVYAAAGVIPPTDVGDYPQQWFQHQGAELYLEGIQELAREIDPAQADVGDFLVFRFGRTFSHGAIIVDLAPLTIVHAYAKARRVTLDVVEVSEDLRARKVKAFTPWGR